MAKKKVITKPKKAKAVKKEKADIADAKKDEDVVTAVDNALAIMLITDELKKQKQRLEKDIFSVAKLRKQTDLRIDRIVAALDRSRSVRGL